MNNYGKYIQGRTIRLFRGRGLEDLVQEIVLFLQDSVGYLLSKTKEDWCDHFYLQDICFRPEGLVGNLLSKFSNLPLKRLMVRPLAIGLSVKTADLKMSRALIDLFTVPEK